MFNEAHLDLNGYVATQPVYRETRSGVPCVSMRVAWTPRRLDRVTGEWADAGTSFISVLCYRKLAENAATCLRKGDPVVVRGRLTVRSYEDKNGLQRTAVEVDASSVGHDLSRGVAQFQRVRPQTGMTALEYRDGVGVGGALPGDGNFGGDLADDAAFASLATAASQSEDADGADQADSAGVPGGSAGRLTANSTSPDGATAGSGASGSPGPGNPTDDKAAGRRGSGNSGSDDEMFDEEAVSMLAGDAAVAAPF